MSKSSTRMESAFVHLLVVLFGTGSWVTIAGIWAEVPVLIARGIPEQYRFNSYLGVALNISFVGPLVFMVIKHMSSTRLPEIPASYLISAIGTIGTFLLIFCWDIYSYWSVDDSLHSTALLVLILFTSFVDQTSNLAYVGFMAILKPNFLNWYWLGQGLSALLPGIAALIQTRGGINTCVANFDHLNETVTENETLLQKCEIWKASKDEHSATFFEPSAFFSFIFAMMFLCLISFMGLNTLSCAKREYVSASDRHQSCCGTDERAAGEGFELLDESSPEFGNVLSAVNDNDDESNGKRQLLGDTDKDQQYLSRTEITVLYVMSFSCFSLLYGVFAPIESFSAAAYGHETLGLIFPLREVIQALAFFVFLLKPVYSFAAVAVTFLLGSFAGCYCLAVAIMSPYPPFDGLLIGKILIVGAWICEGFFLVYCRTAIAWIFRNGPNSRNRLIWYGFIGQIGVCSGNILMFVLINVVGVFHANFREGCVVDLSVCGSDSI